MPIKIVCPKCNANLQVPDSMAGKQGKCKCGNMLSVPAVAAATAPNTNVPQSASARNVSALLEEVTDLDFKSKAVVPRPDAVPTKRSETALLKKYTAADDFQVKPAKPANPNSVLTGIDWILIIFCCFALPFGVGIFRICQGKSSGWKMILAALIWNILIFSISFAVRYNLMAMEQ